MPAGYYVTLAGTVVVYFESDFTGTLSMVAVPADQYDDVSASAGANVYNGTNGDARFIYMQALCYNATMSRWDAVALDSYKTESGVYTATLTAATGGTYKLCWISAALAGNVIAVEDSAAADEDWTDGLPQLTLWGIGHADAYTTDTAREGHTTHLDVYRQAGETTVVAGLGGNLFAGTPATDEALLAACKFTPAAAVILGQHFYSAVPSPAPESYAVDPTYIDADGGWLCTAVTYEESADSWKLRLPKSGSFSSAVVYDPIFVDLAGFPHDILNGSFRVTSIDRESTYWDIYIGVPPESTLTSTELARYNLTAASGRVYCPYCHVPGSIGATPRPAPGDLVTISGLDTDGWEVASGEPLWIKGVSAPVTVPLGTAFGITRTAPCVLLENLAGTRTAEGVVPGDMLSVSELANTPRVLWVLGSDIGGFTPDFTAGNQASIVPLPPVGASIWVNLAGTAIVDREGNPYSIAYDASGYYTVASVDIGSGVATFTEDFLPANTTADSPETWTATMPYGQVCLDESITYQEAGAERTELAVTGRWQLIEAPDATTGDLGVATWQRHLTAGSYLDQTPLASTTLNDAMYFTQGEDPVYKYDGVSLYRAGLPRWPLGLFARILTGTGSIAAGQTLNIVASTGLDTTAKTLTLESFSPVAAGDRLYHSGGTYKALVVGTTQTDSGAPVVQLAAGTDLTGWTDSECTIVQQYRYYCKLTAIDVNGYITQSAALSSGDLVVDMTTGGAIQLQLAPPPAFGALDWDRLELEIYRTKANGAEYYLVHRQVVDWDPTVPYLTFVDGMDDGSLLTVDAAGISLASGLQGYDGSAAPALLSQLEAPPRAKAITSLDNRLLLANLRGWPEAKLNFLPKLGASTITKAQLSGARLLFRRDYADTATDTDPNERMAYEFRTTGAVTFNPAPGNDLAVTASDFTITETAHGLEVGDWVYLYHSNLTSTTKNLRFAGWWRVASKTANDFTIIYTNAGAAASADDVDQYVFATAKTDVPVWLGDDGNWSQRDGNPSSDTWQLQAPIRLAAAINASMRAATTTANSESFTPWLVAHGGADQPLGQLVVRMPNAEAVTPEIVCPSSLADYRLYVNDTQRAASAQVAFETGRWPSRVVRSFRNYPEVFDNPFGADAQVADSIIDVNPADGQEITAIIPMFGESATGTGSQLSQDLLVFKTASVYLVNVESRAIQRLNTRGQGCTAPRSVAATQEGIVFANASGVYRMNRDHSVTTLGLTLSGLWRDHVNDAQIAEACATHYAEGRRYKLAVPYDSESYANVVLVYDYDREGGPGQLGAWTRYTNHMPVWWANDGADAYWASQAGDVFKVRRAGDATDYRDDGAAVAEQVAILRAEDFDLPGVRKSIRYVTTMVELDTTPITQLSVYSAPKLSTNYTLGGVVSFTLEDGRHQTFRTPPPSRRSTHVQVKYVHQAIDEVLVLSGVQYEVAQLTSKAVSDSGDA
jgi:hypothetical protein